MNDFHVTKCQISVDNYFFVQKITFINVVVLDGQTSKLAQYCHLISCDRRHIYRNRLALSYIFLQKSKHSLQYFYTAINPNSGLDAEAFNLPALSLSINACPFQYSQLWKSWIDPLQNPVT